MVHMVNILKHGKHGTHCMYGKQCEINLAKLTHLSTRPLSFATFSVHCVTTLVLIKTNRVGRPIDVTCAENVKIFAMFVYAILKLFLHHLGQMMPLRGQGLNMMNRDKKGRQTMDNESYEPRWME